MGKSSGRPAAASPRKAPEQEAGKCGGGGKKEFDNTNRGVLFPNDKDGNEARPDVTGKICFEVPAGKKAGDKVELRLAGWNKESSAGNDFVSLVVSEFQEKKTED